MTQASQTLEARIKAEAASLGFTSCAITRADAIPEAAERLAAWLEAGNHGEMGWMEARAEQRGSPQGLWPETRSVIMLGMSYAPLRDPLALAAHPERGRISVYAQGQDYHDVMKRALKALGRWLAQEAGVPLKVFVDTAPVMEKPLAAAAGLGWQGKHTNLVSRSEGSWLFLGAIFTTAELLPDPPGRDRCGSCDACQRACPTGAFPAPYRLDARRCISYLTIEHKGPIPEDLRPGIGNRIYGCDDCLAVCPWNKFASETHELKLRARDELKSPALADLVQLDDSGFRTLFAGSPIKRIGHARFLRNVLIAIGNSADETLVPLAEAELRDAEPLIRGAAIWAVRRLVTKARADALALAFLPDEGDISVQAEWSAVVQPARAN